MSLLQQLMAAISSGGGGSTPLGNALVQMGGQSNCMGYGQSANLFTSPLVDVTPSLSRTFQRVYLFDPNTNRWKKLFYNNFYAQECFSTFGWVGIGAEIGLAQRWEQENPTGLLFIFKDGQGATSIDAHEKGQLLYTQYQNRYAAAQAAAITQGLDLPSDVTAFYWDQGETSGATPTLYATQFAGLITDKISDGIMQNTTRILMVRKGGISAYQDSYVASNPLAFIVPIDGAVTYPDALHYDTMTQVRDLGGERGYNLAFDTVGSIAGL